MFSRTPKGSVLNQAQPGPSLGETRPGERREMNSRAKGVRGELAIAHLFQAAGYPAERGAQHDGRSGHADVEGVPYIWIEVKRDQDLKVIHAIEQAERDSNARRERTGEDLLPMVIHRKNGERTWHITMRTIDFLLMCGSMPFSVIVPTEGLITMDWEDWIQIYMAYEAERREA